MYKIFVCTNLYFGEWQMLAEKDRDTANIIAKDLISNKHTPVITVSGNKYKVWNIKQDRQPQKVDISEYQKIKLDASAFEHVELYNLEYLGCLELYAWNYDQEFGAKRVTQRFYSYRQNLLFEHTKID